MADDSVRGGRAFASRTQWFPPLRLLVLLCSLTILIYFDRGAIATNGVNGSKPRKDNPGSGIQGEFKLDMLQDGLLATSLVAGIMISAPISAQLAKRHNHLRLVGLGLILWAAGAMACGAAPTFVLLLASRVVMGTGTGPFIAVSAPLIDDSAPATRKSLWLSALFMCITLGYALGFIVGGVAGLNYGWRVVLAGEGLCMLPFVLVLALAPDCRVPVEQTGVDKEELARIAHAPDGEAAPSVLAELAHLASLPVAWLTILALSLYVGALGTLSFYGPKAAREILEMRPELADAAFGLTSLVAGSLGTLAGGMLLDAIGSSLRNALLLCAGSVFAGGVTLVITISFATAVRTFFGGIAIGELVVFSIGAPSLGILLWSCPADMRPFVLSASEVSQHLLGDVPMPPLFGALQERVDDWRVTLGWAALVIGASTLLYLIALGVRSSEPLSSVMSVDVLDNIAPDLIQPLQSANGSEYDFKRYWEGIEDQIQRGRSADMRSS